MQTYNKIMQVFWLALVILSFIYITYMGITEGFETWLSFYLLPVFAFCFWMIRRWMMKRMLKHQQYLEDQAKNK
ncbi:hypothetical protein [Lishizhenia sp.]|uniref:hypothetical protein n=1 Tax=Lishizhenia sp. TaxID=2497594 RepID=UPI00299D13CD|nr:hypothetical protein [Lishizhenia sp.]MDX1446905.1 hypothetical protein [Lishizhenia sp.]